MKVIENGLTIQKDCSKCKSILEINPEDVFDCFDGIFVICVVCKNKITLTMAEMPRLFKENVKWED